MDVPPDQERGRLLRTALAPSQGTHVKCPLDRRGIRAAHGDAVAAETSPTASPPEAHDGETKFQVKGPCRPEFFSLSCPEASLAGASLRGGGQDHGVTDARCS